MSKRSRKAPESEPASLPFDSPSIAPPDFLDKLSKPLVKQPLPSNFNPEEEVEHLNALWQSTSHFQRYTFEDFVHAGGSGMVFKVTERGDAHATPWAMKIVRAQVYAPPQETPDIPKVLSPVSEAELKALRTLKHPHLVQLHDAIEDAKGVVAICTSYVSDPMPLDDYLRTTLKRDPKGRAGLHAFSLERLDRVCTFLAHKCQDIAAAIRHMHSQEVFHFDIKPANILISADDHEVVLTDMGACIHAADLPAEPIRVHFTWTYAHPDLHDLVNEPQSITGGGLKASATVSDIATLPKYDLFALGKSMQEALAIIFDDFGERANAAYGFRFLHMVSCLLLDGRNAPGPMDPGARPIRQEHGRWFVNDVALNYPLELFAIHRISDTHQLVEKLARFNRAYSWHTVAPELDAWQPQRINAVTDVSAPFTERVAAIFNHPCVRRLKNEPQLGWIREVFPGATQDRWSHSIGVFSALVAYYNALLSDPEVPTFRLLVEEVDLLCAFVSAIIHDVGQTTFGHDFEEACPHLFQHELMVAKLFDEKMWSGPTLREVIQKHWSKVSLDRVSAILLYPTLADRKGKLPEIGKEYWPVDGVASDAINGPIDADKFDYLLRDAISCGVSYGQGMDTRRLLQALTVTVRPDAPEYPRLELAYRAKGRAAVESLLLARYQMYSSVYWHHAFRAIQSMFVHAAAATFGNIGFGQRRIRGVSLNKTVVEGLFYHRVLLRKPWSVCGDAVNRAAVRGFAMAPPEVASEPALEFAWQFADDGLRSLLERLAGRRLFKRVFEMRLGELKEHGDYSALQTELSPQKRLDKAAQLQQDLMSQVDQVMRERGPRETDSETAARERFHALQGLKMPLIVLDFPVRGIPKRGYTPREIGDPVRKYFTLPTRGEATDDNVFHVVRKLQEQMATVRVFAAEEFHELIIRYLRLPQIKSCIERIIPQIRKP